jgi:hypothetical protein
VDVYSSVTSPKSKKLVRTIEQLLAKPASS